MITPLFCAFTPALDISRAQILLYLFLFCFFFTKTRRDLCCFWCVLLMLFQPLLNIISQRAVQVDDVAFCNLITCIKEKALDILLLHTITSIDVSFLLPCFSAVRRRAPGDCWTRWRKPLLWSDQASYSWPPLETRSHGRISIQVQLINEPERRNRHTEPAHRSPSRRVTHGTTTARYEDGGGDLPTLSFCLVPRHLQRFWGASGDFWQNLWTQLYVAFEGHDEALFYLGKVTV